MNEIAAIRKATDDLADYLEHIHKDAAIWKGRYEEIKAAYQEQWAKLHAAEHLTQPDYAINLQALFVALRDTPTHVPRVADDFDILKMAEAEIRAMNKIIHELKIKVREVREERYAYADAQLDKFKEKLVARLGQDALDEIEDEEDEF